MQTLLSGKNANGGPHINVDEQIETGTTNIQIKESDFKKDYTRPQTRGDTAGRPSTQSRQGARRNPNTRKGLHQKHLSTELAPQSQVGAGTQFNWRAKDPAKGPQDSASAKDLRPGARELKAKLGRQADAAKDYAFQGGHVHVPRKFARRRARGVSFNSTGKGLNDRAEDAPGPGPQVNSLVYDKATLEAEKEKERLRGQRAGEQPDRQAEPLLAADAAADDRLRVGDISDQRPNTKQVTFRNANAASMNQAGAQDNIQYVGPAPASQAHGGALGDQKPLHDAPPQEPAKSGTLSR